jgi:hypothetical protein
MSLRAPLVQISALIVGLLIASFLPIPYLAAPLAEVRFLLLMELGVAVIYGGILLRRAEHAPAPLADAPQHLRERTR